jgi:hypothetical protein
MPIEKRWVLRFREAAVAGLLRGGLTMRLLRTGALALLGALAISMMGSPALAQRFVPMRYDLRSRQAQYGGNPYTTYRNYNPYAPYRAPSGENAGYGGYYGAYGPPAQSDPYSFEALQQRNYFVTGNVRAGKSFQGTTPYQDTGSRLTTDLPSLRLSDFRVAVAVYPLLGGGDDAGDGGPALRAG